MEKEVKDAFIIARVPMSLKKKLESLAKKIGISLSDFVRGKLEDEKN